MEERENEHGLRYAFSLYAEGPQEAVDVVLNLAQNKNDLDRRVSYQENPLALAGGFGMWSVFEPTKHNKSEDNKNWNHYYVVMEFYITAKDPIEAGKILYANWGLSSVKRIARMLVKDVIGPGSEFFRPDPETGQR